MHRNSYFFHKQNCPVETEGQVQDACWTRLAGHLSYLNVFPTVQDPLVTTEWTQGLWVLRLMHTKLGTKWEWILEWEITKTWQNVFLTQISYSIRPVSTLLGPPRASKGLQFHSLYSKSPRAECGWHIWWDIQVGYSFVLLFYENKTG